MGKGELTDRIKALSPDKISRVEALVEALEREAMPAFQVQLVERISAFRENLWVTHGLFPDSAIAIRELRENGV